MLLSLVLTPEAVGALCTRDCLAEFSKDLGKQCIIYPKEELWP